MRRAFILLAVVAAILTAGVVSMPPPALPLAADTAHIPEPVRGAIHVHTRRSDGSGTVEQVAAAASRAGLNFVVLSDHGDATRWPDAPAYIHDVLVIDALEVSTFEGHLLALGLTEEAPYRLGGEARGAVEDIARLGGFTIAAHPSSAKSGLQWRGWELPIDGIEWLNGDSEWRDEGPASLARALFSYPWRRPQTLAMVLDRPAETLRRWDELTARRRVAAVAGADAHANLGFAEASNRYGDNALLAVPAYEQMFRTFSVALPAVRLMGNPRLDAEAVLGSIRDGRLYSSIDAVATPARLDFEAESGGRRAGPGDVLKPAGPVTFRVRSTAPDGAHLRLLRSGLEVASARTGRLDFETPDARGAYRVEISLPGAAAGSAPWLLSNPVYIGSFPPAAPPAPPRKGRGVRAYAEGPEEAVWSMEKSDASRAELEIVPLAAGTRRRLRYALGGTVSSHAFAALVMRTGPDLAAFDTVAVTAAADKPTRIWLHMQVSTPHGRQYWRRSLYLDTVVREIDVPFAGLAPVDGAPAEIPLSDVDSIALVIERTHTALGTGGQVMVDEVHLH